MGLRERIVTLLQRLRDPHAKPEYVERLEARQDAVERRLQRVMTPEGANQARRVIREGR